MMKGFGENKNNINNSRKIRYKKLKRDQIIDKAFKKSSNMKEDMVNKLADFMLTEDKSESDQIVEALKNQGIEVPYMVKDNEGHGFYNEENQFDFYREMEKFLKKHLDIG